MICLQDGSGISSYGDLMADFEVALFKQRQSCMSGIGLAELKETRYQSQIQHRLSELEGTRNNYITQAHATHAVLSTLRVVYSFGKLICVSESFVVRSLRK